MFSCAAETKRNNDIKQSLTLATTPQEHLGAQGFVIYLRTQVATSGAVFFHSVLGNRHRNSVLEVLSFRLGANEVIWKNSNKNFTNVSRFLVQESDHVFIF